MNQVYFDQVSSSQFYAYNALCLASFLWLLWKYRSETIPILVILLFFAGMIDDFLGSMGRNTFRIMLLTVCIWQSSKGAFYLFYAKFPIIIYCLCLYIAYFIVNSILINHDNFLLTFSLLSKVVIPFLILTLMVKKQHEEKETSNYLFWLFGDLIVVQILLSLGKMVILGGYLEGWVGSMTGIRGGGAGTSFPLLGLMWLALKNDMKFSCKDIFIALGLLMIGFAAGKRAVWIMFPVLFIFLSIYVFRKNFTKQVVVLAVLTPLLFYLALRISPTFNPENKVWGSFEPEYAINYILKYSGGIDKQHSGIQTGQGRLGAVSWMLEQFSKSDKVVFLGKGNEYITYAGIENYSNSNYYGGIKHRGNITGIVSTFFSIGTIGVVLYLFIILTLFLSKKNRFKILLFLVVLIDYIFYNAQIMNLMSLFIIALYLSFFSEGFMVYDTKEKLL